jgi:hypothetical protein
VKAGELLAELDTRVAEEIREIMTLETGDLQVPKTTELDLRLARLVEFLRLRHNAKHAAKLELHYSPPFTYPYREPGGRGR